MSTPLDETLHKLRARYTQRNPKSLVQYESACRSMPGGNTRSSLFYGPFPLAIERGEDAYIWDCDGHRYIDFLGDFTSGLYGHSNRVIIAALRQALDRGLSLSGHNLVEAQLAELITSRFPSIELVRFTNSGTEANLMALAAARIATGGSKVLVFRGGYHGGLLSFFGTSPLNVPLDFLMGEFNDVDGTRELIRTNAGQLSAILVEPMQGAAGCIVATQDFLRMLREEATRAGAVLVYDEVQTSRLSVGGRQLQVGVVPDMTTLGKYFGGGLSFGAFGGRAAIMSMFDPRRPDHLAHSGTFNNNILSMTAGVAGLREVLGPLALAALNRRGDALRDRLNALCQQREVPLQFIGLGSLFTMHPTADKITSIRDVAKLSSAEREVFHYYLLERGLYIASRGFFALMLSITDDHCDRLVEAVSDYIKMRYNNGR
jgi:glutamate-1-semialdehyde 2,1-aminomutase